MHGIFFMAAAAATCVMVHEYLASVWLSRSVSFSSTKVNRVRALTSQKHCLRPFIQCLLSDFIS